MRLPVNRNLPLAALFLLAGCGGDSRAESTAPPPPMNGPQADYPMVIGEPFVVDGKTWTPADTLNSDQVGYAALGQEGGSSVSAAHRTLPLPCYVEVTELNTGKTILVRLERRGPMDNARLVTLSPGAAAQLGISADGAPVRVRRVNPPEIERALLRSGQQAPARMDTPKSLLAVLMRKLEGTKAPLQPLPPELAPSPAPTASPSAAPAPRPTATPKPAATPAPRPTTTPASRPTATSTPRPTIAPRPTAQPRPEATPAPRPTPTASASGPASSGSLTIQAGAYSSRERAEAVAAKIGGQVSQSGKVWRVRKGPFASRAQAEAELAQVRRAGYSDARIQGAN